MGGIFRNAGEEFQEEILYGVAYAYLFPQVREWVDKQFPDEIDPVTKRTKPNILKEAVESSINVIMMGAMFMIMRYQEAFLEKLFALAGSAKLYVLSNGKQYLDRLRGRIKGRRGVSAINRMKKYGDAMDTRLRIADNIQKQVDSIVKARDSQFNSVSVYGPAAQMHDSAIQKERLYQELGSSKVNAKMQLAMFKMFTGSFNPTDKTTLKHIYKTIDPTGTFDPSNVDIEKLNKISEFMFVTDDKGKIMGLTDAFLTIINGMGYMHKTNSGAA